MIRVGIPSFGTDTGRSGIGSYLRELILRFDRSEYAREFAFELIGPEADREYYLKDTGTISWYQVEDADQSPIRNYVWNQRELPRICRRQAYDVLFLPAANRRLTGRAPCPAVGTVHDLASLHVRNKYDFAHRVFNRIMLPRLIRKLDYAATVSSFSRNDIVHFARFPENRIVVTPLAADMERFFPVSDRKAAAATLGGKYGFTPPYILYISRLEHPGKNHVELIRAYSAMREQTGAAVSLVLPGPDRERAEEIHAAAAASPYAEDIVFPGFIDADDVPDFYRGAEIFIMPSLFEGFGLPVLEAMACGTPVITSDAASLPEVGGPQTPRFKPGDTAGLSGLMGDLLGNPDRHRKLAEAGISWARSFSWERTAEQTTELLRTAAGS